MLREDQVDQQKQGHYPELEAQSFFRERIGNEQLRMKHQWLSRNGWMFIFIDGDVSYLAIKYANGRSCWYMQNGDAKEITEHIANWAGITDGNVLYGDVSYLAIKYIHGSYWYMQNRGSFDIEELAKRITDWTGIPEFE